MQKIKCVAVGDPGVGKTSLLWTYVMKRFPEIPPTIQQHTLFVTLKGVIYNLCLLDVAGSTAVDMRTLAYGGTDVFLVCFDVSSTETFESAKSKWVPEIRKQCSGVPYLAVGTKQDLGDATKVRKQQEEILTSAGASAYVECSSLNQTAVQEVIEKAIEVALATSQQKVGKMCAIS